MQPDGSIVFGPEGGASQLVISWTSQLGRCANGSETEFVAQRAFQGGRTIDGEADALNSLWTQYKTHSLCEALRVPPD